MVDADDEFVELDITIEERMSNLIEEYSRKCGYFQIHRFYN